MKKLTLFFFAWIISVPATFGSGPLSLGECREAARREGKILGHKGLLKGRKAVCYEGFEAQLEGAEISSSGVAEDGIFITARGAGVAVDFGLKLVEKVHSKEESLRQRNAILCD